MCGRSPCAQPKFACSAVLSPLPLPVFVDSLGHVPPTLSEKQRCVAITDTGHMPRSVIFSFLSTSIHSRPPFSIVALRFALGVLFRAVLLRLHLWLHATPCLIRTHLVQVALPYHEYTTPVGTHVLLLLSSLSAVCSRKLCPCLHHHRERLSIWT